MKVKENIKNGFSELIYTNRFYLIGLEPFSIALEFDKNNILTLVFNLTYDGGKNAAEFHPMEGREATLEFNLRNFGSPFGTFVKTPLRIGELNGRPMSMMFGVVKPKDGLPILDVSIYAEKNGDE